MGVDDRDHRVQPRELREAVAGLVGEGEGLGHGQWLRDPGRLDEQVVKASLTGQARDLLEQIVPERAADAPVGHLHELLFGARQRRPPLLDDTRVDVDLAHVIDDHGDLAALTVVQHMIEQGRLARAQKARQDGHR